MRVSDDQALDVQLLPDDQGLHGAGLQALHRVLNAEAVSARVRGNFIQELRDELFLLDKLHVSKRLCRELDGLVEASFTAIANVKKWGDDNGCQSLVEEVCVCCQVLLELGRTCNDETLDVGSLAIRNEHLRCCLSNLAHVVVTFFQSETCKTQGRLSSTAMLLWQVHREFVQDFTMVSLHSSEQRAVTIHDQEPELVIILHELSQRFSVKLAVAEVHGSVDWFERLEIDGQLLLLVVLRVVLTRLLLLLAESGPEHRTMRLERSYGLLNSTGLRQNLTTENDEAVWRSAVVLLQTLLS